jgi:hypothetical protein
MAIVGRLAGALLAISDQATFLIGELKEPLDYGEAGYRDPGDRNIKENPITVLLSREGMRDDAKAELRKPKGDCFTTSLEGKELADLLAHFFLIRRNGIVSERLWRLVMDSSKATLPPGPGPRIADAAWLASTPWPVWEAVRDAVLRC